jgi:beta-lactamase class A
MMMPPATFLPLALAMLLGPADDMPANLESALAPLIEGHKGHATLAVKNLKTGESFAIRGGEPMPTASLIKFPVMIEAYRQAAGETIDLGATITLTKADKVPGSGLLTYHFSDGATFPLRDAIRLMIAFSDNTATNLVVDRIGIESTAACMAEMGCPNTKLHSKVFRRDTSKFPERSKQFGLGSTTADEMIRLLERLDRGELVDRESSAAMKAHLMACDDADKFPRSLPAGTKIAFKTGSVDDIRTAAGIIETASGPVALCVLTRGNEDRRYEKDNAGNVLCAEVARAVLRHFGGPIVPRPPSAKP